MLVGDALARLFSIWTIANNPLTADRAADAGALARKACGVRNRSLRGPLLWVGRQRGGWCPLGRHRRGLARGGSGGTEGRRRWNLGKNFLVGGLQPSHLTRNLFLSRSKMTSNLFLSGSKPPNGLP